MIADQHKSCNAFKNNFKHNKDYTRFQMPETERTVPTQ